MDSVGEGEGGKIWENGIETCVISCIKRVASPGLMHDTGCLGLVHWDNPEGWYGEGRGRRVQDGEHMYTRTTIKELTLWKESYDQPRQHIQKQTHYFANKGPSSISHLYSQLLFFDYNNILAILYSSPPKHEPLNNKA